mmetsp:Transcript_167153/g.296000  ORF Transcript_167153/g.296000 Transcript_167153/m.296000 type:complete len:96 (-) Transcript_167153:881-1168(-)
MPDCAQQRSYPAWILGIAKTTVKYGLPLLAQVDTTHTKHLSLGNPQKCKSQLSIVSKQRTRQSAMQADAAQTQLPTQADLLHQSQQLPEAVANTQ